MVVLTDDAQNPMMQPTKNNITRAMGWLTANAQANDSLFLHYSGKSRASTQFQFWESISLLVMLMKRVKLMML